MVIVLMGAAGAGKTTIGRAIAAELGWPFVEGDEYHPPSNLAKMHAGIPLTDVDRAPWLRALAQVITGAVDRRESIVVACSALKRSYRDVLLNGHREVRFVYLKGTESLLHDRLLVRGGHFFNPVLVHSQLATLEEPDDPVTIAIDAALAPETILATIRDQLGV